MTDWPPPMDANVRPTRFALDVSCPQCAGPVTYANGTTNGLLSVAILACEACRRDWEVTARLVPYRDPERQRLAEQKRRQRAKGPDRSRDSASV